MMLNIPRVKLQDETVTAVLGMVELRIDEPVVLASTVRARATEQVLVEAAGVLHVADREQGLCAHTSKVARHTGRRSRGRRPSLNSARTRGDTAAGHRSWSGKSRARTADQALAIHFATSGELRPFFDIAFISDNVRP